MDQTSNAFMKALENNDIEGIQKIEKSDLHNHSGRGGSLAYLVPGVVPPKEPFHSLREMEDWFNRHIKPVYSGKDGGWLRRIEAAFHQAGEDHIRLLALNFGMGNIDLMNGMPLFMKAMDELCKIEAPDTIFLPELGIGRNQCVEKVLAGLDEIFSYHYFKSIDLNCGEEECAPIENFIPIYRKAKEAGLVLKAHIGEIGTADDIRKAVEVLELDEVHHGVAAVTSNVVMKFLADNKIRLNVCPTSNYMLGVCPSIEQHPIRKLYDKGILITVNTDDMLIFNSSVSEEFLKLYQCGLMKAEELNEIRLCGLRGI